MPWTPRGRGSRTGAKIPAASFDQLVGASTQDTRYGQSERLGGIEVHDQLELGRLLDRQVRRIRALEDMIDIGRRAPIEVYPIGAVVQQPAARHRIALACIDRR